jgi:hypothetical protein
MFLDALPGPLARVDLQRLVSNLDGSFRMFGAKSQAAPMDVVHVASKRPPFAQMSTCVLESKNVSRAVISNVRANPFFASVSLVVHPGEALDAPSLVADLRIVATGRSILDIDAAGPATHRPLFMKRFHTPLARVLDGLPSGVGKRALPKWMAPMSGGCGARLVARPLAGRDLERVLLRYVDVYLGLLSGCPAIEGTNGATAFSAGSLADLFVENGPSGKYLTRAFGQDFAARYARLVWHR